MKKLLLLLLLLPYLAIAQSADATPIENILLTNAAEKSSATRVTVQDATTKELGFILKSTLNTNISIGNKNANTFQLLSSTGSGPVVPAVTITEAGLSTASDKVLINTIAHTGATGLNQGGLLTINTDAAKFDLSAGFGYIVNGHSNPDNITYTKVTWTAKIANIIPNLATQKQTYVAVDINGDLFLTNVPLTATQRRNYIRIGVLIHLNNSAVTYIDNQPTVNIEIGGQVQDILEALGFRSLSGNRVFPVSNNLKIKKELGRVFKSGANFENLKTQPHSFTLAAQEPITFRYRTQTGAEGSDITDITPAIYDFNGTITPVAATATLATIQRVYIFQDGVIRIQPGQRVFTTLNAAITAINSDFFVTDLDIAENGLYLGAIVLTRNTVDLSNISQAIFAPSIGTTANGSVASPALGYTAEDVANKQNSLAVDGTGAKYTTVDAVNSGLNAKISGTGTTNQLARFTASGAVGNSGLLSDGTNITFPNNATFNGASLFNGNLFADFINPNTGNLLTILNGGSNNLLIKGKTVVQGTVTASPAELETELATLGQVNSFRPYKVYTALLSQSGTNAPVATVLENTLGGTVVWSRNVTGAYTATLTGAFTTNKTFINISNTSAGANPPLNYVIAYKTSVNTVVIQTYYNGAGNDTLLDNSSIEIRVYN
jgi:hypothetical protein